MGETKDEWWCPMCGRSNSENVDLCPECAHGRPPKAIQYVIYVIQYTISGGRIRYYIGKTRSDRAFTRWEEHRTGKGARCLRGVSIQSACVAYVYSSDADAIRCERKLKQQFKRLGAAGRRAFFHDRFGRCRNEPGWFDPWFVGKAIYSKDG